MRQIFTMALFCAAASAAVANAGCDDTYKAYMQVIKTRFDQSSMFDQLYNQHCEKSGEVKSASSEGAINGALDSIKLDIGGKGASSSQRALEFCKTQAELRDYRKSSYSSDVSGDVEMGRMYNQCKLFENAKKISITDSLASAAQRTMTIGVSYNVAAPVVLNRVTFGRGATCQLSSDGKSTKLKDGSGPFTPHTAFSVTCIRDVARDDKGKEIKGKDGEPRYERLEFQMTLNDEPYTAIMPAEGIGDFDFVDKAKSRYLAAEKTAAESKAILTTEKVEMIKLYWTDGQFGDTAHRVGCLEDPDLRAKTLCAAPSILTKAPENSYYGEAMAGNCRVTHVYYACLRRR